MPSSSVDLSISGGMIPRFYQRPYMMARERDCKFLNWIMHRRGGKDRTALAQACRDAFKRVGLYWHCLPTLKQGRKVVWDNITSEGKNLIEVTFPREIVAGRIEDEMKLTLRNGSIVQIVGADNFNSLLGASPVHVTFSEWALTDPRAYDFVRPILRENDGSVAFITTPRGYNHAWRTLKIAEKLPGAFCAVMPISVTGVLSDEDMQMERDMGMAEELIQQEYYCDFAAANVGSIIGKYIAQAEREGRISNDVEASPGGKIVVSGDIGRRDAAAWWFWQLKLGGFDLVDYIEDTGLDAEAWIARLKDSGHRIDTIYLPHDARAKTMATPYSVIEIFADHFNCEVVPKTKIADRINAARVVAQRCSFNTTRCERGLECLRAWSFHWDDDRRIFSTEPEHNWASHGSDAFSYGAQMVKELVTLTPAPRPRPEMGAHHAFSLEDLYEARHRGRARL